MATVKHLPNYQGPGIYRHYKGGTYVVVGLVRLEWNNGTGVAYMTTEPERRKDEFYAERLFIIRPLDQADLHDNDENAFNDFVNFDNKTPMRRFWKIA